MPIADYIEKSKLCFTWLEKAISLFIERNQNKYDSLSLNDFPLNHDENAIPLHEFNITTYDKKEVIYLQIGSFNYVFNNITQLPGLTNYPKKSRFFISIAPHLGYRHIIEEKVKAILTINPDLAEEFFLKEEVR